MRDEREGYLALAALSGVLVSACAHAPPIATPIATPTPADEQAAVALYEDAAAVFARHDAAGAWDGAACHESLAAFEGVSARMRGRSGHALYMSGLVAARCGNASGARDFYGRALEVEPGLCEPRVALGLMELEAGHTAPARAAFEAAVEHDSRCAPGYVNLAILESQRPEEREAALANLRRALAVEADYLPALDRMALIYLEASEERPELLDLAEMVCRQAQLVDPDHAPLYNTWALIDVAQGDITSAAAKLARAIELDPRFFEAQMNFGQLTLSQRAYADAERAFAAAREVRPDSYDAALGHGVALRGLRRPDEAEQQYRAALELDGDRAEAYFDLAVLYHEHRDGTVEQLVSAERFLEQFVARAADAPSLAGTMQDVLRWCSDVPARGRARSSCQRGRAQVIHDTLVLLEQRPADARPAWTR